MFLPKIRDGVLGRRERQRLKQSVVSFNLTDIFLQEKEDNLTGIQFTDQSSVPSGAPMSPLSKAENPVKGHGGFQSHAKVTSVILALQHKVGDFF